MTIWTAVTLWGVVRFIKLAGFALLALGVGASIGAASQRARLVATYTVAVPGFVITWTAGWALMKRAGYAVTDPWIVCAIGASLVTLHAVFLASHRPRPRAVTRMLAGAGLAGALAVMVGKSARFEINLLLLVPAAIAGALLVIPWARTKTEGGGDDELVWRGLKWIAWAEGVTLLVLLCLSMPLRRFFDIHLDGGTGVIGWAHGVLVIVYLQTLWSASRTFGWSWRRVAIGVVAALVPAGTFVLFRWLARERAARAAGR